MQRELVAMETVLKALADTTRLRTIALLSTGETTVGHIHESLEIPQSKTSRHLAYLRKTGLVAVRRDGLRMYYRVAFVDDPAIGLVERTVAHALTHLDTVHKDAARLRKLATTSEVKD